MNEELKYPIQYAVLEIKEKGGYIVGYQDIIYGYIVSKCYVSKSEIEYLKDGTYRVVHKVVFPFKDYSRFKDSLQRESSYEPDKVIPSYDACGRCYPVDIVSDLFDSYEEAKILATQKNEEMRENLILKVDNPNDEEEKGKLKEEFAKELAICQMFEQAIQAYTEDMNISDLVVKMPQKTKVLK